MTLTETSSIKKPLKKSGLSLVFIDCKMEVLYFFTLAVGGTAILLIFNLFLNLKKTDKVIEQVQERQEEIVKKPAKAKQTKGISLKTLKHDLKKQEVKDFKHGLLVTNLKGHIKKASSGAYSQNGKLFLSGDGEQSILLWTVKDFGKGNTMYRINTDYQPVKYVGVSPDSKAFIAALENNKTRVYKIIKKENGYKAEMVGTENPDYNPKTEIIYAKIGVQFQSGIQNGAFLFHCYRDHLVVITDLSGTVLAQTKCASPSDVGQIQLSNCGKYFGFCGDSSELRVWAIIFKSGSFSEVKRVQSLIGHSSRISSFCFSPDSTRILTLGIDGHFKVWNSDVDWIHGHVPHELFCFESPFGTDFLLVSS